MWWIVLALLVLIVMIRIWYRLQSGHCTSQKTLDGKTVIVTGASAGKKRKAVYFTFVLYMEKYILKIGSVFLR